MNTFRLNFFRPTSMEVIQFIALHIQTKCHQTYNHSLNVSGYAAELARLYGMNKADIETIRITGLLHDVGKIMIPSQILYKPESLTFTERKQMQLHSVYGYEYLKAHAETEHAIIARHHHERWDGTGYPDGLKGVDIPLKARIVAIADAFDAMLDQRSYKKSMTIEAALNEIENNQGLQFDPELARLFIYGIKDQNRFAR